MCRSYRDPPPAALPKLHPKTPSITAIIAAENSATRVRHEPMLAVTEEVGVMEEYVEPDVFRIDRETQEEIDVSLLSLGFVDRFDQLISSYFLPLSPTTTRTR